MKCVNIALLICSVALLANFALSQSDDLPADTNSTDTDTVVTEPVVAEPADTKPVVTDTVVAEPADTKPVEPAVPEGEQNSTNTDGSDKQAEETDSPDTKESDELDDTPKVLDTDSIGESSDAGVHTVKLMLYIIAPVSALVVIYFIMKGLRGNSRMFLNRYHIVGGRADNIELRPLGCESEEEEDVVFESSRLT